MKKNKIPLPIWVVGLIIVISLNHVKLKNEDTKIIAQANKYYKMHNELVNIVQSEVEKDNKNTNTVQIKVAEASYEPHVEEKTVVEEITNEDVNFEENASYEEIRSTGASYTTRLTSYYPQESSNQTGSGLSTNNFQINDNGWYTYNGKLVVATATEYLLKYGFSLADGVHTYRYYDEIVLNIDGVDYEAIVLDSCGSSMSNGRIDLFVSGADYIKDTMIEVKEN